MFSIFICLSISGLPIFLTDKNYLVLEKNASIRIAVMMFSYINNIFRQITVEPINVLFLVGILSVESVRQDFFLQSICRHEFPGNDACNSSSNYNKTMKDVVETKTATYITIWYTLCYFIIFIFIKLLSNQLSIRIRFCHQPSPGAKSQDKTECSLLHWAQQ